MRWATSWDLNESERMAVQNQLIFWSFHLQQGRPFRRKWISMSSNTKLFQSHVGRSERLNVLILDALACLFQQAAVPIEADSDLMSYIWRTWYWEFGCG
ncbi:hypothetical protein R1flu_000883 [Riccia fluitans]|uniref:Uncharacterized protein n=1 Tax=Riccia fluitans TaxID=41844 RepID=A0ABD1Y1R6_9MARC